MNTHKCPRNYSSKFAWTKDNRRVYIDEISNIENNQYTIYYCENGHQLVYVDAIKRCKHFRHINPVDCGGTPMTVWHSEWQSHFKETEVKFQKKSDEQKKNRRCDAYLRDYNSVVEFQHSFICADDVCERGHDHNLHGNSIAWIIHGNDTIQVNKLQNGRIWLDFISDYWKYSSFQSCEYVYYDIDCQIYKVYPTLIKSHMIDVQPPIAKAEFISKLTNGIELWEVDVPIQCTLEVKQQGAGNGKTFEIVQQLISKEWEHYSIFIMVSKQHSAKDVMYREIMNQVNLGLLSDISIQSEDKVQKKYVIQYQNTTTGKICKLIIGTVDSFMCSIGTSSNKSVDQYMGVVNSIIESEVWNSSSGCITYGRQSVKLCKTVKFISDETQDLPPDYAKAIIKIMRESYIDSYIVGDKLQSLAYEDNAFTYLLENQFSNITTVKHPYTNICRRFSHPQLVSFVNRMVPFEDFDLPPITPCSDCKPHYNPLIFIHGNSILGDTTGEVLNGEVDAIMKLYIEEVELYGRESNDFLFVTPFTTKNVLLDALELAIIAYWQVRCPSAQYLRHAVFHKSELGTSINTSESDDASRLVSIHSSKGDGRKVVFVISMDEQSLTKFSENPNSLMYNSLVHVAITRMKEKLYIRLSPTNDSLTQKMVDFMNENDMECKFNSPPQISIKSSIKLKISGTFEQKQTWHDILESIIGNVDLPPLFTKDTSKQLIDMSYHNVRFAALINALSFNIIATENTECTGVKRQIFAKLVSACNAEIKPCNSWKEFNICMYGNRSRNTVKNKTYQIPILRLDEKGDAYIYYYECILKYIRSIQAFLQKRIKNTSPIYMCPYQSILLEYMKTCIQGDTSESEVRMMDVYNITDAYCKAFKPSDSGHEDCACKCVFKRTQETSLSGGGFKYIHEHCESVSKMNILYKDLRNRFQKLNYLEKQPIELTGNRAEFICSKQMNMLGYNGEYVINFYIKPQFNSLNYNDILMDSIFDTYLIMNPNIESANYIRFHGKRVVTAVFSVDCDKTPYYIEWFADGVDLIQNSSDIIRHIIRSFILTSYTKQSSVLYDFYKYYRNTPSPEMKTPSSFIEGLRDEYLKQTREFETLFRKSPKYISDLLYNMQHSIDSAPSRKAQGEIIRAYESREYFMSNVKSCIEHSIDKFLGIVIEDEDAEDEDDMGFYK